MEIIMKRNKSLHAGRQGFTLIEILISVGILAIVATLIAQVLFTTTHVNKKTEIITDIKQDGNYALDVIGRMVRSAKSIDVCQADELVITNPDNNVTTLACVSDGNAARIASQSATQTVYLSGGNLTLSRSASADCVDSLLAFSCPPVSGGILNQATVTFTLGQVGISGSAYESGSASFQSIIRMRN
jgi:prepilin-type N-terminal cleavage/methylation domain-containing protein